MSTVEGQSSSRHPESTSENVKGISNESISEMIPPRTNRGQTVSRGDFRIVSRGNLEIGDDADEQDCGEDLSRRTLGVPNLFNVWSSTEKT